MHGLIFASLRAFLSSTGGPAAEAAVFGLRAFSESETYEDDELSYLTERAAGVTGRSVDGVYSAFGHFAALTSFKALFPDYYARHSGAVSFLLEVEGEIHRVVRRTVPGARPPHLRVVPFGDTGVLVTYTSPRRLCALLEGLVGGVVQHYGQEAEIEEVQCQRHGDLACVFRVELVQPQAAA
jgi:hypothetical protein